MHLPSRVRGRVAALISALGEELVVIVADQDGEKAGEPAPAESKTG
ncbi:hypothetical protein [Mesorhizobium silamurunense]|nr:hypothetical protein [Mesorhizobium silamurunense]